MRDPRQPRTRPAPTNAQVAGSLREAAELLAQQGANFFRYRAYSRAADTVESLPEAVAAILRREGVKGLVRRPTIGEGIAAAIAEMIETGSWSFLDRLRGASTPERVLQSVPAIGPAFAHRIHDELHVDSLEELELAAHDGRLETVVGIGPRRAEAIRAALAYRSRRAPDSRPQDGRERPSVEQLLEVDRTYREQAAAGALPTVSPRRFNPGRRTWLPIGHYDREPWHFTALHSNTARAHRLGRTGDWVVLYAYDDDHRESQHTVVTESTGPLAGRRVVRGREPECLALIEGRHEAEGLA